MFCKVCGYQMPDDAKFCGKCGAASPITTNETQETAAQAASVQPIRPSGADPSRFSVSSILLLAGGVLSILGFFLPIMDYSVIGYSLFNISIGAADEFSLQTFALIVFLLGGILSILSAFTKPKRAILSVLLGLGGFIYLYCELPLMMEYFGESLMRYISVGFYLSIAGIAATIAGSIFGFKKR